MINKIFKGLLTFCVVWLPVACSGDLTDAQYVDKAESFLDQGELSAATIELKNALLQNRENAQAHWLLGKVYLDVGDAAGAEKELRRASEFGGADGAVLPLLARALLAQGKHKELQSLSPENLTTKDQMAAVLAAQGLGKLAQGEEDMALNQIDQAVLIDPESAYAGIAKARLLAIKREDDLARRELDRVFTLDADYASAWSLLGDLESRLQHWPKAESAYTKAIQNSAHHSPDMLKRALIRIEQQKYEEAQKDVDVLKKRFPQQAGINYAQGLIHFQSNLFPEARDAFELTLQADNNRNLPALYYLSQTHLRLGNLEQAEHYGNQYLAAAPYSIPGRTLMASINLGNREYATAEQLIRPVVDFQEDDVATLNLEATALLKQNKTDEAIEQFEKVVDLQPDSAGNQLRLGQALLAGGQQLKGLEHIEKALKVDPQLQQAHIALVRYYINQKDYDNALAVAEDYRDRHPNSVSPYHLIGHIRHVSGKEAEARLAFEGALKIAPGDPVASRSLATLAIRKKEYWEARGYYQDVLAQHENHLSTLLDLAALDALEKKEQAMLEHLQQAMTAHPKAIKPRVLLARYYLGRGQPEKVPGLMLELSELQRHSPDVLEVMARSQLDQKQYANAKLNLEQLVVQQPNSAQAHFLLAQAHAGLGNRPEMREELERTIELAPGHFTARLALTKLMLRAGQNDKAADQLAVLDKISPEHPDVLKLKAMLARLQGDQDTASGLLEDVFEKSPSTANMYSLARQKWAMGEQKEAVELQEQWAAEHPDDIVASLALADAYNQQGQVEHAIDQYKKVLEIEEENVYALNDLAWHLRGKQPALALEYAERAAELAPDSAVVLDTLAVVLLKNDEIGRAKRNMERALAKNPNAPAFRYHNAMIDAAAGDKTSAINALQSLLDESGNFPEKTEAEQLLAELQGGG